MAKNKSIPLIVSVIALALSLFAVRNTCTKNSNGGNDAATIGSSEKDSQNQNGSSGSTLNPGDAAFAEKVKRTLLDDPEIIMEALNLHAKKERKKILSRAEVVIRNNPNKYSELAIKIGKIGSKKKVFCFFDPHQSYAVKQIANKVEKKDNDIEFNIFPLVFPTQDYSTALLYICSHKVYKDSKKFQTFLVESAKVAEHNEASWKNVMTKAGYDMDKVNNAAKTCEEDVNKIMTMAHELGVLNVASIPVMIATVDGIVDEDYKELK